ncbi:hypothetical protein JMJ35_001030 [Cladonia borealis]|uniref:Uncharacterized protein n=1 Tax=Cladonia borealis TaxID=184061 RepID=A0AA39R7L9_9LECA|nr:hypothetical protein JMJ35_001030 [Cladonia borealis]
MDDHKKKRSAVYEQLYDDLHTVSLKSERETSSQDADDILNPLKTQQISPEDKADSSPRVGDIMSWTLDSTYNSFHHRKWDCYDVHCEAAARILRQSDVDKCTGFHPRLVLFVLDLQQKHLVQTTSVRFKAERHILSTFGVAGIQLKDAVTFAKHPGRLKTYHISAASFTTAWSYDSVTGSTVGMLSYGGSQGSRITQAIIQGLIDHEWLCGFPMLLALLAQRYIAREMEEWFEIHVDGVVKAAELTGYHHNLALEQRQDRNYDPAVETAKLSGIASNIATNHHCWEGMLALARFTLDELQVVAGARPRHTGSGKWKSNVRYIREEVDCLAMKANAMCQEATSWQQKASIQIQGLFNIIAQREQELGRKLASDSLRLTQASLELGEVTRQIAEDSKRDSTSMKAIAAVTMCFLPGTFAASLFAMPVFRWDEPAGNNVINHRIWVYWAVAIPLTALTVSLYWVWDHIMNRPRSTVMNKPNSTIMNDRRSTKSECQGPQTEKIVAKSSQRSSSRSSVYSENGRRYRRGRNKVDRSMLYLDPLPKQNPSSNSGGEKMQSTSEAGVQTVQPTSEPSIFESYEQRGSC